MWSFFKPIRLITTCSGQKVWYSQVIYQTSFPTLFQPRPWQRYRRAVVPRPSAAPHNSRRHRPRPPLTFLHTVIVHLLIGILLSESNQHQRYYQYKPLIIISTIVMRVTGTMRRIAAVIAGLVVLQKRATTAAQEQTTFDCFVSNEELRAAVLEYVVETNASNTSAVAQKYGHPIGTWCVDSVSNFSGIFDSLQTFNEDISAWSVSNAVDMSRLFFGCTSFNQPLNDWDTSNVMNMNGIFQYCTIFNQSLSDWGTYRSWADSRRPRTALYVSHIFFASCMMRYTPCLPY
jgi:surface protein